MSSRTSSGGTSCARFKRVVWLWSTSTLRVAVFYGDTATVTLGSRSCWRARTLSDCLPWSVIVIWHPADLVHANNFVSDGHNLNLVIGPDWLEGLPSDISLPACDRLWEGGLPYRIGLELYRGLNRDAQISDESVFNLISLCASSKPAHGQTRWLPLILEWMNDEYSCALTLSQASTQAGVHPVHVSRSFRRTLGCTFREYLTLIRIRRATDLLKQSSTCITEIAFACGFSDHAHFTRTFKRATGLTPTAYRIQTG